MQLLRDEKFRGLNAKNISPIIEAISKLPSFEVEVELKDCIEIIFNDKDEFAKHKELIFTTAKMMKPWRKGPFCLEDIKIDSEWQSFIKYNLLEPHLNLKDKIVGDIGCNNGYYLFRMLELGAKKLIGFDPSMLTFTQFQFINHFIKSDILYEPFGVEDVSSYKTKFDVLLCLGVLYHRSDPISSLKSLYKGLNSGGELILDTFMIDGEDEMVLTPKDRYSKIPNVYFIPTIPALKNWCYRAGFKEVEVLYTSQTTSQEQRKTEWIDTQSLEDFLNPQDSSKTIEGYPAPKRVYILAKKM